jgi:hypothetical protein
VVLLAADEQQRSAVLLVVDPCLLVARLEVCDQAVDPDPVARRGDGVSLPRRVGVLGARRVGEGVVELLGGEGDRLVDVGRVLQGREKGPDL